MELVLKYKLKVIWCSYHFNTPFCVNLQYPQSKREILCQKEKQYLIKLHGFFYRILCWMDIFFDMRLIIYQRGITMNIITFSRISLIIFPIHFLSLKKNESYASILIIWRNKKNKYILLSNFDRIKKSTLFFSNYYSIESIPHNSFKVHNFLKTGVHGKYILISLRGKFT